MNIKRFSQFINKYYLLMGDSEYCLLLLKKFTNMFNITSNTIGETMDEIRTGRSYENIIGLYLSYDDDSGRWFFYPFDNEEEMIEAEKDEDISCTFAGEFKYENGEFYIDPLKSDAKKYNL